MSDDFDELKETFKAEAMELLGALETSLLELEGSPDNQDTVCSIFRVFHTLKGTGSMCGFDEISRFTHEIESVYDLVRSGKITPDKDLIDITLAAGDLIRQFLSPEEAGSQDLGNSEEKILSSFRKLSVKGPAVEKPAEATSVKEAEAVIPGPRARPATYRIRFRPASDIFKGGTNPIFLLNELQDLGECTVVANTDSIPDLFEINPEACYTFWDVILSTDKGVDAIKDIFIFVENESEIKIEILDDGEGKAVDCKKLREILFEKRELSQEDLEMVSQARKMLGEILIDKGLVDPVSVEAALAEQEQLRQARGSGLKIETMSSIRVSSLKLDQLVNLVGEMVTVQARLTQACTKRDDPELLSIAEEVERLTTELRDNTMEIRMMPIGTTFSSLKRLVRDLSRDLGKQVEFITDGGETELDKTVIEKLHDPLVHLIRNSLDHGIETPEDREKAGKKRSGLIHLAAAHSGDHVVINIMDDGKGLDTKEVREKAIKKGMITPDMDLTEKEIFNIILAPGFTTAEGVTSVSGRGVGMDVVKRAVDTLRGTIHIDSIKGKGSTITLILPLTLAIIEGLLVKIGEDSFVLPLSYVQECVELTENDISRHHGRHIANVRGEVVPYIRLREHFRVKGSRPRIEQIIIVHTEELLVGLVVDSVIGQHQTVVKTLGKVFKEIEGISGATILGDGTVALIVDIEKLVSIVEKQEDHDL